MGLLARREHSRQELARKLARGGAEADPALVGSVLDELAAEGLQSDRRFADALARRRVETGHGPLRVIAELREHGLEAGESVDVSDPEWLQRARAALARRFGEAVPRVPREVARQLRFLQYRGFTAGQARRALDARDDID